MHQLSEELTRPGTQSAGRAGGAGRTGSVIGRLAILVAEGDEGSGSGRCGFANQCLQLTLEGEVGTHAGEPRSGGAFAGLGGFRAKSLAGEFFHRNT